MADTGPTAAVEAFIAKWKGVAASELSTAQTFALDLCALLGVDAPHATPEQDYMFERPITFRHGDGSTSAGRIDLYRRGAFVLESKKVRGTVQAKGFDDALLRARSQAEAYARALPASEGRPPFVVVVDVGHRIELYSEFSRSGGTYVPFPDPRSHRIALEDLRNPAVLERLRKVWTDPLALDPSRESARVTRGIATQLAELAKSLERSGHPAEAVAQFLMRCLFTMFAEDVKLLPSESFRNLLLKHREQPDTAMRMLEQLWRDMDHGGFSAVIAGNVLQFNGKLFKQPDVLPLDAAQLALLIEAARADWKHVEPAIFGTLLERALEPGERHKLGAHYTPRAYVERLVLPTVIEPLRAEWSDAQAAAGTLAAEGKADEAVEELRRFHHRLCTVRVLDPACGSGNFLYVTLEHLKRLEGEVLNALDELGYRQTGLALGGERADARAGETVDPHNLLGIELNPRAAAIAEVVLWIGYLQWHYRTRGDVHPPQPVIRDFRNIENRDAVLAHDGVEYVTDERGVPVTRWDGKTMKPSPVTGEDIPDESARVPVERYLNPRKAAWPEADFVVGNPPFIGNKRMRTALGGGYVEALRGAWPDVPESADFVMYWWHHAAQLTRCGGLQRFGLITTNSISQTFNRRVIENAMAPAKVTPPVPSSPRKRGSNDFRDEAAGAKPPDSRLRGNAERKVEKPLSLVFAIPDHPWVDTADGAAVRIAMTAAAVAHPAGLLRSVIEEDPGPHGESEITLRDARGSIASDLRTGADLTSVRPLEANSGISSRGVTLVGKGFVVPLRQRHLVEDAGSCLKKFVTGRGVAQNGDETLVLDFFNFDEEEVRLKSPAAYQWLLDRVRPERMQNNRESYRVRWWTFAEPRSRFRKASEALERVIITPRTSKHRYFLFAPNAIQFESEIVGIAVDDPTVLGVLSSALHVTWSLAKGGTLEDRPRYQDGACFSPFPFPDFSAGDAGDPSQQIATLAEQLDTHRKRQQTAHSDLTLTGMYNVLDKLRSGEALTAKERVIHEHGLVSVLRQLHDDLDAAVLDAYGWSDLLPLLRIAHGNDGPAEGPTRDDAKRAFDDAILERLVALNAERAAEEARGHVRWLRPDFQNPQADAGRAPVQPGLDTTVPDDEEPIGPERSRAAAKSKDTPTPWPKDPIDQVRAVADVLAASPTPLSIDEIAARFTARGPWKKRLPQLLEMLVALGRAEAFENGTYGV